MNTNRIAQTPSDPDMDLLGLHLANAVSAAVKGPTPTTNIRTALVTSLNARRGVPAGLTWGDFQAAMSQLGVTDGTRLASIEYGIAQSCTGLLVRDDDEYGGVEIREVR